MNNNQYIIGNPKITFFKKNKLWKNNGIKIYFEITYKL